MSEQHDDRELMESLVDGDHRALELLIGRWERPLYSFAYRYTQNEGSARDIVQETFVRIFTKRDSYDSNYPFSSWIFTIAANLCKNRARWQKRHPEISLDAELGTEDSCRIGDVLPSSSAQPCQHLEYDEELELLKEAVMALPHDLRAAVLLHHYESLSYYEISEIVGCSPRGVETRLYRARKLLRQRMTHLHERQGSLKKKTRSLEESLPRATHWA